MGHGPLDSQLLDSPTKRGSQFVQSAHERMISKNPTARTKDKRMTASFVYQLSSRGFKEMKLTLQSRRCHCAGASRNNKLLRLPDSALLPNLGRIR